MWVYQVVDILSTIIEGFGLYVISRCLCKEPRFPSAINKFIPPIAEIAFTAILTWFTELGAWKMPLIFIFAVVILKVCYKDSIYQNLTVVEIWLISVVCLTEIIGYSFGNWLYGNNQVVLVDGQSMTRWEIYTIGIAGRLLVIGAFYLFLKNFKYKMQIKDSIILTLVFLIAFTISFFSAFNTLNLGKSSDFILYISSGILAAIFMVIFMYSKNVMYLREQEQRDKMQIAQLQQQYAYYQDKLKDEERIRSIYHDMKNHLLVLESGEHTAETRKMAQELRAQIADYEDYVHTGNEFLDIIIKDKAEKAREKEIDFSAFIDFGDVEFIEPLDISTLFGNGIDNAIEACEKLPREERMITVKAGKVRDFVSIVIENNCAKAGNCQKIENGDHQPEENRNRPREDRTDKGKSVRYTSKTDKFFHGFGISNMKKAAEKYNGSCTTRQENGKFTLKILLPAAEGKAVE